MDAAGESTSTSGLRPGNRLAGRLPQSGPERVMMLGSLANSIGNGMVMSSMVLYFTRVVHMSPTRVGLGMTIAGLCGIGAGIPIGDLADRRGPREVLTALLFVMTFSTLGFLLIHSLLVFVAVFIVDTLANNAAQAVRIGLIRRVGGEGAAAFRAKQRAVTNAGIAIGMLAAAVAIQADTATAYRMLIIGNAISFLVTAVVLLRLPHYEPLPRPKQDSRWSAARDLPFNAWAIINGLMVFQYQVLLIPLPLWIIEHTHAPRWSVACVMLINTIMCVLLQVRVGGKVETVAQGARAYRIAGLFFLASCTILGLVAGMPGWAAVLLIAVACVVHTIGELWHASGQFAVGFELSPKHATSQYQGMEGLWSGLGFTVSPLVLTLVCIDGGRAGWIGLGVVFAVVGLGAKPATVWAERTRERYVRLPEPEPAVERAPESEPTAQPRPVAEAA